MNKEEAIIYATKFTEDILSFFGLNVAVSSTCEDEVIELSIPSTEANAILIGKDADNLRALQSLISANLRLKNSAIYRVNLDIADYKKHKNDKLIERAEKWIERVRQTGQDYVINLNPADRRIVHKLAQDYSTIETHSEGEGSERRLIISRVKES